MVDHQNEFSLYLINIIIIILHIILKIWKVIFNIGLKLGEKILCGRSRRDDESERLNELLNIENEVYEFM